MIAFFFFSQSEYYVPVDFLFSYYIVVFGVHPYTENVAVIYEQYSYNYPLPSLCSCSSPEE